ncbi:helix-turn-helix domain-containing protein [Nocardioides zhouii]|uniref:XRE family transcriptional regulator n=1 Tax=Nocardioides zhouii TaxID=1168729 RepID=A0A4V1RNF9_9ACTN|nr:helix-turn-helix domain-containing protein [Nocardioides zhouii]RYC05717.1 XRE family transcriptional regulator [Nocardioides zhouii]
MATPEHVLMSDAIFLSMSGEGRRLRERADVSVPEVAAAAGTDVLTLLRWETGQVLPSGSQSMDWARVVHVLRCREPASHDALDGSCPCS